MLNASELRLGNWVYDTKGKPSQVNEIKRHPSGERDFAYVATFQGLGHFGGYVDDMHPIQLTPEILEKCGFNNLNFPGDSYFALIKRPKENYYDVLLVPDDANLGVRLFYLHQLQNIYFALTSEELIVKL